LERPDGCVKRRFEGTRRATWCELCPSSLISSESSSRDDVLVVMVIVRETRSKTLSPPFSLSQFSERGERERGDGGGPSLVGVVVS